MMNKKLIVLGAACFAATSYSQADDVSVTTTFAWESSYVFRGVQLAEETYMPSLDFAFGSGYLGIWAAMPVGTEANEVDFYAGYGIELDSAMSLDIGVTHYTYPDSGSDFGSNGANTEVFVGAAFDMPVSPSLYAYYDFDLEVLTFEASAGYSKEIDDKTSVDLSGALGYVDPSHGDSYTYALASISLGYAFNDYVSGSLYANYSWSSDDMMGSVDPMLFGTDSDEFWFGFSVTGGF